MMIKEKSIEFGAEVMLNLAGADSTEEEERLSLANIPTQGTGSLVPRYRTRN